MFGTNEIVGKKFFKDNLNDRTDQLFVTSMFLTLQGEGPYRGEPAFFIRLAKCNLDCTFCDTYFDDGDWMTFDEINDKIESTIDEFYQNLNKPRPEWTKHHRPRQHTEWKKKMVLVITGGEPMLQENLNEFLATVGNRFEKTQIETNGTQHTVIPERTTLVCSPKCLEKNGAPVRYLKPRKEILERANCLKFVMEADPDSPYSSIPDWAHKWREETGRTIFISPMNIYKREPLEAKKRRLLGIEKSIEERSTVDEIISFWEPGLLEMGANQENHEYAAQYCVEHGYVLNLQIHLYASLA